MTVILKNIEEFKKLLSAYKPSEESIRMLENVPLATIMGATGSGKNTIINHLINSGKYHFVVSDTTRPPKLRNGEMEEDGVQYFFRNEEDILNDIKNGKFLEAEVIHNQQVSGTSIRELRRAIESGKIPVSEVDIGGVDAIINAKPDTKLFFIVPPSYKEWMYRLKGREVMTDTELNNRIATAKRAIKVALESDRFTFILNDSSHASSEKIDQYMNGGIDEESHQHAREVAKQILKHIE